MARRRARQMRPSLLACVHAYILAWQVGKYIEEASESGVRWPANPYPPSGVCMSAQGG